METIKLHSKGNDVRTLQRLLNLYPDGVFGIITHEAVIAFQSSHGLIPDGVVGQKTWDALMGGNMKNRSKRTITEIIVHCTATRDGMDCTVEDIRRWHKQQGWSDIGYHYVVYRDGSVHNGRSVDIVGAHCKNHNAHSIGVCYVGGCDKMGKPKDTRTNEQKAALVKLLRELRTLYPTARIYSHHDFDKGKACPSFEARNEYKSI